MNNFPSENIVVGKCYKIGNHEPIVITSYEVVFGRRRRSHEGKLFGKEPRYVYFEGFSPEFYEQYKKFYIIANPKSGDFRTIAEVEHTERPPIIKFRVRISKLSDNIYEYSEFTRSHNLQEAA